MNTDTKRSPQFTEEEKLALTEAYKDNFKILNGSFSSELTKADKHKAWKNVLQAVNAVSNTIRTLEQTQEKYKNMKRIAKSTAANNRKEINKTGGGPADTQELDTCSQNILETIPKASIFGLEKGVDTSKLSDTGTPSSTSIKPCLTLAMLPKEDFKDGSSTPGETPTRRAKEPTSNNNTKQGKAKEASSVQEHLLEKQVKLFGKQLQCMLEIRDIMKRRLEIEEEKLAFKKRRHPD